MKYIKVLIGLFAIVSLSACNTNDEIVGEPENFKSTGIIVLPVTDEEIIEELEVVGSVPHIILDENQVLLLDLTTGERIAIYELNENMFEHYDFTENVLENYYFSENIYVNFGETWILGSSYYAVEVISSGLWDFEAGDFEIYPETRIIIFDKNLNPIEVLAYDAEELPLLFDSVLRFVDGNLFVYGLEWNGNTEVESTINFLRVNVHTGEVETLFAMEDWLSFHEFISDHHIFISSQTTDWNAGRVNTKYGVLDLETGDIQSFEREGFARGHVEFHGSKVLIAERHVTVEVGNEIIVFNLEDMSNKFIELEDEESMWARFSFDGNYIVTINETASVFRKYDMNGTMIAEVDIEHPSGSDTVDIMGVDFKILPITEQTYAIHMHIDSILTTESHLQFITLP